LIAATEVSADGRLLDIGTGTGVVLAAATSGGVSAVGVDPSVPMLIEGRRLDPALAFAAAETINLPFQEASFDAVTASFVLPLFTRLDTALFDVIRVLRPGGRLGLVTWETGEDELQRVWRELAERAVGLELLRDGMREVEPWAAVAGDRARLETALRDAGLHPVKVERRQYRLQMSRADYIEEKGTESMGRFVREMLGPGWNRFVEEASTVYADQFPETLVDFRDVLVAVGTKP